MKGLKRPGMKGRFSETLLEWNRNHNSRLMPWKGEKDPYKIWLSEIILQQTRVEQGLGYYNRFVSVFPNIEELASAQEEKVFKLWEGLGYYTRCRNLIATARLIANEYSGVFPDNYEKIRSLKGIGPYTAAAISSFAFDLPHAVVDGNVFRVLSRIFGISTPVDISEGKKTFSGLANELLDKKFPGEYNQSIMDFGAVICKPASPDCPNCIFKTQCWAFLNNKIAELPVREKRIAIKKRWFYYLVIKYRDEYVIRQRTEKDIWNQLFEFPLHESGHELDAVSVLKNAEKTGLLPRETYTLHGYSPVERQKLSHQLIEGQFFSIQLLKKPKAGKDLLWVKMDQLNKYAFPRLISKYLEDTIKENK